MPDSPITVTEQQSDDPQAAGPQSTGQQSTGRAVLRTVDGVGNFLVWTGEKASGCNWINIARVDSGYAFAQAPNRSYTSGFGPAFVLMPDAKSGYVAWTDAATSQVMLAQTSAAGGWVVDPQTVRAIGGSKAAGGPDAELHLLNGQPVVSLVWQDAGMGALAYADVPVLNPPGVLSAKRMPAGPSCVDTPEIASVGGKTLLAFFDARQSFNLLVDPAGALEFQPAMQGTPVSSAFGPALVPVARDEAYLFWTAGSGDGATLQFRQLGLARSGAWVFNDVSGGSGAVGGATPTGAPYAQLVQTPDPATGTVTARILVCWPDRKGAPTNMVNHAYVTPVFAPILNG